MSGMYDLNRGVRFISLKETEEHEHLLKGKKRIHPVSFSKMIDTVDMALCNLTPSASDQLVWTKTAALLGYNSKEPTNSTNHLWTKAAMVFLHHEKSTRTFVGCLVRWRIRLRAEEKGETWLTINQETGGTDNDTGRPITAATYWINNNFTP